MDSNSGAIPVSVERIVIMQDRGVPVGVSHDLVAASWLSRSELAPSGGRLAVAPMAGDDHLQCHVGAMWLWSLS